MRGARGCTGCDEARAERHELLHNRAEEEVINICVVYIAHCYGHKQRTRDEVGPFAVGQFGLAPALAVARTYTAYSASLKPILSIAQMS